jgi:hypothetical protein
VCFIERHVRISPAPGHFSRSGSYAKASALMMYKFQMNSKLPRHSTTMIIFRNCLSGLTLLTHNFRCSRPTCYVQSRCCRQYSACVSQFKQGAELVPDSFLRAQLGLQGGEPRGSKRSLQLASTRRRASTPAAICSICGELMRARSRPTRAVHNHSE